MFDFYETTGHEAAIVIYTKDDEQPSVIVSTGYGNVRSRSALPVLSPFGYGTIWWPEDDKSAELVLERGVEDVREEILGKIWQDEDGDLVSDLDIVWDENADLAALFGFKAGYADPDWYKENPGYAGKVYRLTSRDDVKIVVPELWS